MNPAAPNAFSWVLWILVGLGATIAVAILWQRALACHRRTRKVLREDALKALYHITARGEPASIQNLAGALYLTQDQSASLIADLERHQDVSHSGGHLHLTDRGRAGALRVIRAHRLWESHLAEETSVAEAHWHSQADRKEHLLSPTETDALAARLGHPTHDPHGDPIPTRQGQVAAIAGRPLTAAAPGRDWRGSGSHSRLPKR